MAAPTLYPVAKLPRWISQTPNLISLARLLSAPWLGWLVLQHRFGFALVATFTVGLTDWLDGWVARHLKGGETRFGLVLDPLADKAMLVTLFLCCGPAGLIPIWLVALVLGRDSVIVAGATLVRVLKGPMRFTPLAVGKVSTFFQMLSVLLVLIFAALTGDSFRGPEGLGSAKPAWLRVIVDLCLAETAFFTAISGLGYVRRGIRLAGLPRNAGPFRNTH